MPSQFSARRSGGRARSLALGLAWFVAALAAILTSGGAAAPPARAQAAPAPFSCSSPTTFLAQGQPTALLAGTQTAAGITFDPVGPTSDWNYNAIGFNPVDDFIYGTSQARDAAHPVGHLLRIDSTGAVHDVGAITGDADLAAAGTHIGTVSPAGVYYAWVGQPTPHLTTVNVSTAAAISSVTLTGETWVPADWTFLEGYLWGLGRDGADLFIYRLNPSTGVVSRFLSPVQNAGESGFGGAWTYGNGNLGFSNNDTGNVHQIRVTTPAAVTPTFTTVSSTSGTPPAGNNDGSACLPPPTDLAIQKTGPSRVAPDGTVTFTLTVTNNGPANSSGFVVDDNVPAAIRSVASATPGCTVTGNAVRCVGGALAVGRSATITITGTAPSGGDVCMSNTATLLGNEADPGLGNNSSTMEVCTSPLQADLALTKTPSTTTPTIGGTLTYALRVVNHGPADAQNVVITDTPAAGIRPTGATTTRGSCSSATACQIGTLAPGAEATMTVTATAIAEGAAGNSATVTTTTPDPDPSDNTSSSTVDVRPSADLRLAKTASTGALSEGEDFTYTITVTNDGPSTASGATVTDSIPAGVAVRSVSTTSGTCSQGDPVVCTLGSLADGAQATITIRATATDAGVAQNTAVVVSPTPDPDTTNNQATSRLTAGRRADLEMDKTSSSDAIVIGQAFDYLLKVTNKGPSRATGVVVTDTLPAGLQVQSVSTTRGTCTTTGSTVRCVVGELGSGATATVTITALATREGPKTNGASVTSEVPDPTPGNNTDNDPLEVGSEADLSATKSASRSVAAAGDVITYGITVRNAGPSDAADVTVSDPLPAGTQFESATPSAGTCEVVSRALVCRLGTVANGASVTVQLRVRLTEAGSTRNAIQVTSPTPDPDPSNNYGETQVTTERADVSMSKRSSTDSPRLGSTITYTLTARNAGPSTARGVIVTDPMPDGLRLVSTRASDGSCDTAGSTVICNVGDLASGDSATVTIRAVVLRLGLAANTASAVSSSPTDPTPANNVAGASVSSPGTPRLALAKTVSRTQVRAGSRVTFRLRVRNRGTGTARNVTVCDLMPAGLVYVSSNRRARLRDGRHCWTWSSLAAGRSATVSVVTRALPGAGGRVVNRATASAGNARATGARRALRVLGRPSRAGGVTG